MTTPAISVEGLGKHYWIARRAERNGGGTRIRSILRYASRRKSRSSASESLWAIRDVSFNVSHGDVVGLIGANGAGKSTLLKVLSRITEPTEGVASITGRVGSLLEVGTGFHPELTGRENVYLSGAILGMRRAEINRKFDEIVEFAEVQRFLDTPVKRYSSGMYVRLAFAVAAHLEPEILLVDEVLAVGDVSFQKKCLGKMRDVGRRGKTVLFVSHNMTAIQNLCQRVIWLEQGHLRQEGNATKVVGDYLSNASPTSAECLWESPETAPGNDKLRLRRVRVVPTEKERDSTLFGMGTALCCEIEYWNFAAGAHLHVSIHVAHEQSLAFSSASDETDRLTREHPLREGLYRSVCMIPSNLLNAGVYTLTVLFRQDGRKLIFRYDDAVAFEVFELESRQGRWLGRRAPGPVHPKLFWETSCLAAGCPSVGAKEEA